MQKSLLVSVGCLIALAALVNRCTTQPDTQVTRSDAGLEAEHVPSRGTVALAPTWGASPFSVELPQVPDKKVLISARRTRMVSGGIETPDAYFHMNFKELTRLGQQGDVAALLQLGERYWSEPHTLAYDPDTNLKDNAKDVAIQYFVLAIRGGALQAADLVARRTLESGDIVEAAAWRMALQKIGRLQNDATSTTAFSQLTYEQHAMAQRRADWIKTQSHLTE